MFDRTAAFRRAVAEPALERELAPAGSLGPLCLTDRRLGNGGVGGELLAGEAERGALESDLGAKLGAARATSAPAELVQPSLGVGEALFGSRAGLFKLAAACRELARGSTVEGLDLVDGERLGGPFSERSRGPLGDVLGLPAGGEWVWFVWRLLKDIRSRHGSDSE